jgi:hypothetical protein
MKMFAVVIAISFLVLSSPQPMEYGPLTLDVLTKQEASGSYMDEESGNGIKFSTDSHGGMLQIETLDGRPILVIERPFNDPFGINTNRLVEIAGSTFLQHQSLHTYKEYYLTQQQAERIRNNEIYPVLINLKQQETSHDTKEAIEGAIASLFHHSHYPLIERAARYMGETMELTGNAFPSLLPLYMTALATEKIRNEDSKPPPQSTDCLKGTSTDCTPCTNDDCYGLCGPNCICWKFVCGNCCYNKGCFEHDLDCYYCGFDSIQCIALAPTALITCGGNPSNARLTNSCTPIQ